MGTGNAARTRREIMRAHEPIAPAPSRQIAARCGLTRSTVTEHLRDAVDNGAVDRRANPWEPGTPLYAPTVSQNAEVPADD